MPDHAHNIFRDGKVHVLREQCSTCIFRAGNLMGLNRGRVRDMVDEATANEGAIVCHQTLGTDENAVCRGFFDLHPTNPLKMAARLDAIREVEPPEE